MNSTELRTALKSGLVIPAHPLALTRDRKLDERRQRALTRYYLAAGVGGLAVGVHTTQFAIRQPSVGLYEPVLELAREEMERCGRRVVRIGGVVGSTGQAIAEAQILARLGYDAALLSLAALKYASDTDLVEHCRRVSEVIPLVGFYLQPAVGGRFLSRGFWTRFAEIENVVAIKIAPFNRYQTLDVIRGVLESGRPDIALYTGNDDNIVMDLVTPYLLKVRGEPRLARMDGGLLGHWAVWTKTAVEMLDRLRRADGANEELLQLGIEVTDSNAAFFDAANGYAGCIAGLHEVLRRQGLLEGTWCLDPNEGLSEGQSLEIDRVYRDYPHLNDDEFVARHRDSWLAG